jgi:hypothetical protein
LSWGELFFKKFCGVAGQKWINSSSCDWRSKSGDTIVQ